MRMELTAIGWVAAALVVALLISFIATPVVKSIAQMVGAMDVPKDNRRMHNHPIPRMGGLAIFLGFLLSTLIFVPMSTPLRGMLLGGVIIVILGMFDDIYALPALPKLLVQIAAALVAVLHGNVIEVLSNPNLFSDNPYWILGSLSIPLSVIWIVAITNAVNLIDGLDGLAVGVATISSLTMLVIAMLVSDSVVALMMAALAGGCIGFMPYNMNPPPSWASCWPRCPSRACSSFTPSSPLPCPSSCWACPCLTPALPFCGGCPRARAPWPPTAATSTTGSSTWALTRSRRWPSSMWSAPSWACPRWYSPPAAP